MKKKLYLIIVPIVLSMFLINLSFGTASLNEVRTTSTEDNDDDDLDYHVQRYLVVLEVDGLDLHTTINITYNVIKGNKSEGFKRFLIPRMSMGKIDKDTIKVYDDEGHKLKWEYKTVDGYKEISFKHSEFTGIKTITMKFIMKKWIVEYFSYSEIELRNIGTFKVDVKKAKYKIIFPKHYELNNIENSESGIERIDKENGKYIYTFVQKDAISKDITIRCRPNLTNTPPQGSYNIIIVVSIILTIIGLPIIAYCNWWYHLSEEKKEAIRESRRSRRRGSGGCGGCGGGCGGCGGGCGGCGG